MFHDYACSLNQICGPGPHKKLRCVAGHWSRLMCHLLQLHEQNQDRVHLC